MAAIKNRKKTKRTKRKKERKKERKKIRKKDKKKLKIISTTLIRGRPGLVVTHMHSEWEVHSSNPGGG